MNGSSNSKESAIRIAKIVILVSILITMPFINIGRNSADPVISDNLDSTKTTRWDFQNADNYTEQNVTLGGGMAALELSNGSWLETDYSDFSLGWTDANTTIGPDGNVTLKGNVSNLIDNGDFSALGNWNFV
ncbi:MAG: hypothetical protein KAI64_04805, partial [Thermoplasmata archaeon]|nr:hypothetical protein [Thermoplasmata archaeon]